MEVSPEGPALAAVVDVEEDVEVLAQVGAHQTLHLDKQVMRARRDGSLFLPVPMLHLDRHTRTHARTHTHTHTHTVKNKTSPFYLPTLPAMFNNSLTDLMDLDKHKHTT